MGVGALRQGRNVCVGAGQRGDLALPNLANAEAIIGLALLLPPHLANGLRESGLLAHHIIGIGLHGLTRLTDLACAPITVIGHRRFQRGAVRAGAGLADGLAKKVLLGLLPTRTRGGFTPVGAIGEDLRLFGGGTISDVIVVAGDIICGDEFVADVVAVQLVVLRGTAAKEINGKAHVVFHSHLIQHNSTKTSLLGLSAIANEAMDKHPA